MRGGVNHQRGILTPQRRMLHPQLVHRRSSTLHLSGQMPTKRRGTVRRWQVTRRPTSGPKSTVVVVEKMAESPLSADVRGVGILRATILKKISTLKRHHVGVHPHMRRIPLAPRELRGGGGGAWHWRHICGWWSGRASSGPTCRKSMTGPSTPQSSCRFTPPLSLRQGGMRPF
jgi:hypothetical protein